MLAVGLPLYGADPLTVILVRHAEIAGTGSDPPLSAQGQSRAELLASMLRDMHLEAIYVTQYRRTQQTAEPSAKLFHLRPEQFDSNNGDALIAALRRHTPGIVLVVGHSNTVPAIIAQLSGREVRIAETEFDSLFVLSILPEQTSLLRFHYGSGAPAPPASEMRMVERSPVMQITFVKSGGFAGAIRNVRGTVNLKDDGAEVSSDASYHRTLSSEETEQLRAGADPSELSLAATQIAARTARAADLDHYQITLKTKDNKTHNVTVNTSGASNELQGLPPQVVKFLRWIQEESQRIWAQRSAGR